MKLALLCLRRVSNLLHLLMQSQALPAKLMLAFSADHVIAPIHLLDTPATVLAWACLAHRIDHGKRLSFLSGLALVSPIMLRTRYASVPGRLVLQALLVLARHALHEARIVDVELS